MKTLPFFVVVVLITSACNHRLQSNNSDNGNRDSTKLKNDSPLELRLDSVHSIDGTWILTAIDGISASFKSLYSSKKPFIKIDASTNMVSGNTSCNSFSGETTIGGRKISFEKPLIMSQRFCVGDGESEFLTNLKRVNNFKLQTDTLLLFFSGESLLMRFTKSNSISQ